MTHPLARTYPPTLLSDCRRAAYTPLCEPIPPKWPHLLPAPESQVSGWLALGTAVAEGERAMMTIRGRQGL